MTKFISGISDIANDYDAYIIDLWGVLHDGTHPYDGAIECLQKLRASGKKIVLLSNAPRRASKAQEVLSQLGFTTDLYDYILTSGEVTFDYLTSRPVGNNFYYIGPQKDEDILDGSNLNRVDNPQDADFAIVTGFDNMGDPDFGDHMALKKPEIHACLDVKLPLYCANPDRFVVKKDGRKMLCAGILAEYYADNGGEVTYFGKPYQASYDKVFELLGFDDTTKYCAIGDSLHTDIAGANALGIYSILVAGGILAKDLQITQGQNPTAANLQKACDAEGVTPKAVISSFIW